MIRLSPVVNRKSGVVMTVGRTTMLKVFGGEVRRFRVAAGLSQDRIAAKIPISGSHIGKIERGETRCDRAITVRLDELLDTRGTLPSLWDELVKSAAFPVWFDWPPVEEQATLLQSYENQVIYGLLQTEGYASELLNGDKEAVAARMGRQQILIREDPPPPRLAVLLTEYVLYHEVGNREIMREQLEHLLSLSSDRISVHIVPGPLHPSGTDGAFVVATLPDRSELAYMDTVIRGLTIDDVEDIRALSDAYEAIRSRALPVDASKDFIRRVMEERWL
ncbi:helix-turn-helix transcriptional regulator [Actinoallomurus liliacearum]|uniref:Helix-turn-helix transcriptional regulator n=1 Tax=Actinoallomurus liliacearum TaxID=1080073 RepID=A0ABP8TVK7_9ACTN